MDRLYGAVVDQARSPVFYSEFGVADHLEGRFDLLVLHLHLVIRRLSASGESGAGGISQMLFDTFFHDMDRTLRAIGVGDMSVGKKIKDMVRAYYGRCAVYEDALAGRSDLEAAITRNVYGGVDDAPHAAELSAYVVRAREAIDGMPVEELMGGRVTFPPVREVP